RARRLGAPRPARAGAVRRTGALGGGPVPRGRRAASGGLRHAARGSEPRDRVASLRGRARRGGGRRRMKSHTTYLTMNVPARMDFVNITDTVAQAVAKSGV